MSVQVSVNVNQVFACGYSLECGGDRAKSHLACSVPWLKGRPMLMCAINIMEEESLCTNSYKEMDWKGC